MLLDWFIYLVLISTLIELSSTEHLSLLFRPPNVLLLMKIALAKKTFAVQVWFAQL